MGYVVRRWWGREEPNLPRNQFDEILEELSSADEEHPDVALRHETEWVLSYSRGGRLVFENVESSAQGPRHLENVPEDEAKRLWNLLADGRFAELEKLAWLPGY